MPEPQVLATREDRWSKDLQRLTADAVRIRIASYSMRTNCEAGSNAVLRSFFPAIDYEYASLQKGDSPAFCTGLFEICYLADFHRFDDNDAVIAIFHRC